MQDFRSIAVWQTAFLGDAVLTLPLVQTLARAYPGAHIDLFVRKGFEGIFTGQKELRRCVGFDKRGREASLAAAWRLGRALAKDPGYDLWVPPHASLRSAVVAMGVGAGVSVGYTSPLWNRLAYTHTVDRRFTELEEIERLLQLVQPLGITDIDDWPRLTPPEAAVRRAAEILAALPPGPVVGVHPGSVWPTKRWPAEYFAKVVDLAIGAGMNVALFAGPGEEAVAAETLRLSGRAGDPRLLDLSGTLTLLELAACLGRLSAYLTNDSGPMHVAWCQGTPTVALFGPTVRNLGFFPRGERTTVLEAGLDCRPCGLHGGKVCKLGHHRCMRDISPEAAWEAVRQAIEGGSRP